MFYIVRKATIRIEFVINLGCIGNAPTRKVVVVSDMFQFSIALLSLLNLA